MIKNILFDLNLNSLKFYRLSLDINYQHFMRKTRARARLSKVLKDVSFLNINEPEFGWGWRWKIDNEKFSFNFLKLIKD